jgi:hypothetical protein
MDRGRAHAGSRTENGNELLEAKRKGSKSPAARLGEPVSHTPAETALWVRDWS